jgi:K+-transporting ATPase c subunit
MAIAMTEKDFSTEETAAAMDGVSSLEASGYDREVSVIDARTQLAYRKWLIGKATCLAILIGLILCFALPVRYSATTKIMLPQQTKSTASMLMSQLIGMGSSSLAAMAGGGLGLKNPNDTMSVCSLHGPSLTKSSSNSY